MVLPLIYANVREGIDSADRQLLEMARVFRLSRRKTFRYCYLPAILPFFLSAISSALGFAWKSGIAAEAGKYYRKSVALSDLNPVADVHTIDFEDVQLGTESQDGSVAQTYYNVLSALGADRSGWEMDDSGLAQIGTMYTVDGVNFNGFYYDEGGYYKTWGGFGFSSNVSSEFSMTTDLAYQFHAMTADGGDNKFSVVYDFASGLFGPGYESAVDFPFAVNPVAVDVTNTPMMGAHMGENPAVKFVGYFFVDISFCYENQYLYLSGRKSGSVTLGLWLCAVVSHFVSSVAHIHESLYQFFLWQEGVEYRNSYRNL